MNDPGRYDGPKVSFNIVDWYFDNEIDKYVLKDVRGRTFLIPKDMKLMVPRIGACVLPGDHGTGYCEVSRTIDYINDEFAEIILKVRRTTWPNDEIKALIQKENKNA